MPFTLAPTATATVVSAPVSDVPPNHMLHFYIDLLMPMSQSEENVAFKKEISCKLKYLKVPDGKYEVEATEELRFQPPFAVAATLHPTGAKDRMMLQIECKNTLWTAAAVRKYALALAGGVKVIADPNGGLLKGYVRSPARYSRCPHPPYRTSPLGTCCPCRSSCKWSPARRR